MRIRGEDGFSIYVRMPGFFDSKNARIWYTFINLVYVGTQNILRTLELDPGSNKIPQFGHLFTLTTALVSIVFRRIN
jgi:hypothetical protein